MSVETELMLVSGLRLLLIGLCLWALLRGGGPERTGAALLLCGYIGKEILVLSGFPITYESPNIVHLAYTGILFCGSLYLAIISNRIWPLFFSAFCLVQFTGHVSVLVGEGGRILAYWLMTQVPIILQAFILSFGTLAFIGRASKNRTAPDWRLKISE
jgi:hypothetical protein